MSDHADYEADHFKPRQRARLNTRDPYRVAHRFMFPDGETIDCTCEVGKNHSVTWEEWNEAIINAAQFYDE